jgi:hypothetical protein
MNLQSHQTVSRENLNLMYLMYMDKRQVNLLSSIINTSKIIVERFNAETQEAYKIENPSILCNYTEKMKGLDLNFK